MNPNFAFSTLDDLLGKDAVKNTRSFVNNVSQLLNDMQPFQQELYADVLENDTTYVVLIDIPGCSKADIKAEVVNENKLVVTVSKNTSNGYTNYRVQRKERLDGAFHKEFLLPETIDCESITAKYDVGVLAITFRKLALHVQTRSVPIL